MKIACLTVNSKKKLKYTNIIILPCQKNIYIRKQNFLFGEIKSTDLDVKNIKYSKTIEVILENLIFMQKKISRYHYLDESLSWGEVLYYEQYIQLN